MANAKLEDVTKSQKSLWRLFRDASFHRCTNQGSAKQSVLPRVAQLFLVVHPRLDPKKILQIFGLTHQSIYPDLRNSHNRMSEVHLHLKILNKSKCQVVF